ncbi:GWxTD domain-containing protein [candidate division KSB1 bacterium]|nr:GWxTD domain-containing protein [candidate division KSB1 bacterium]NIR72454.1 GWxTD domain-containing protein [candidate division KSB1 bacterium]NIS25093.1 GWxTD domain-containing protein [candidate division KSB1 bacterium]NIT72012.1 GWxTD domain-containing protein [candidate division KSB1 bacterium]NIU25792.1 GWxTD domain-containing protein [candidate division KSB1 bacterium]
MRHYSSYLVLFILLVYVHSALAAHAEDSSNDFYRKGLTYKKKQDWVKALGTWFAGKQILQQNGSSDPRIGVAFIEYATEKQATRYYELACDVYFWGLSDNNLDQYGGVVEEEVERIAPLLNEEEYEEWRKLLEQKDSLLYDKIKSFWARRDPTPSTDRNERLLEHWKRIAYARKNFKKARNTPYGTDDRGLIYVKYGKPERIIKGTLGTNRAALKQWTDVILDNSGQSVNVSGLSGQIVDQTLLLQQIDRFNRFPEYEIWFYYSFVSEEPVFYLFGNDEGIGQFGLRDGVEDFIPSQAFLRSSARKTKGVLPGPVLQSLYYSELMHLAPYFEDRYYELTYIWDTLESRGVSALATINHTFRGKRKHYEIMDRHNPNRANAPAEKSTFDKTVSSAEVVLQPFRYLDDKNQARLALVTLSYPAMKRKYIDFSSDRIVPAYSLTHTLIARDRSGEQVHRLTESSSSGAENVCVFDFKHLPNQYEYTVIVEVFDLGSKIVELNQSGQPTATPEVIGLDKASVVSKPPLATATNKLELSDLIIGVKGPKESELEQLPFPLIPGTTIWSEDPLQVYLEIYNLQFDSESMGHFVIDFEVVRLEGEERSKEESIALSFSFDSSHRTFDGNFEIDISKLTSGNYELLVTVTDSVSKQEKGRTAAFEIVETTQK